MYLNCHTFYSLKYGTLSVKDLISEACDKGAEVLALTDINNTSAAFDFYRECKAAGIKPLIGIEYRNGDELLYVGLARNNQGFYELNHLLSKHHADKTPLPSVAPELPNAYIIYPYGKANVNALKSNEFMGVGISDINKLIVSDIKQRQDKLLIFHPVTFRNRQGYNTHRLLRAIDRNTLLSRLPPEAQSMPDAVMLPIDQLLAAFGRFQRIIKRTMEVVESCEVEFNSESKNRKTLTGDTEDDRLLLEKLAFDGLQKRYGNNNKEARSRVLKELDIINRLNFNAYFLITWDILKYAINRNFSYVGRGSGANSIVAYCLGITDVDPIELDLYFERFLNPYRTSPPDFDIDFSWRDRDEIIDYIFKKYRSRHTALLATYSTFKGKSIIRELGKVFGLPKPEIDVITRDHNPGALKDKDHIVKMIFKYGDCLQDFPNHLSIHAGGILISENPIHCYTATDLPPKGFPITHFDMFTAEDMGFYKYDILSQRGLGHIKDAISIIKQNTGKTVEIHTEEAKKDPVIKEHIRDARTIGCFYVESPAMRMLLKKLKCEDYPTLVAASSIIRPGVAQSGMMQQYIRRFHNPAEVEHLHPKMGELLKETFGVMVYQEDVIKVAHHFAGLDLGEADILRRAMSGKYKGYTGFKLVKDKFFTRCREQGYAESLIQEVWRQIESFGGYSFSKAHSASFAVESYHSLYLKAYYPLEFMVAVINNWGGFYNREFYFHEARKNGADIQAPCVNHSEIDTTIEGKTIYIGFAHMKDFERKVSETVVAERKARGHYKNLEDFTKRILLGLEQLNILIRVGAFRFTGKSKKVLLLEAAMLFSNRKVPAGMPGLFETSVQQPALPALSSFTYEDAFDELDILGFPVCSPFDLLPEEYHADITAGEMKSHTGQVKSMLGYYVTVKDTYTKKNELMHFGHFTDPEGDTFDTTHFPPSLKKYPFKGPGFYFLKGKIVDEFGHPSMEVHYMEKLPMVRKEVI